MFVDPLLPARVASCYACRFVASGTRHIAAVCGWLGGALLLLAVMCELGVVHKCVGLLFSTAAPGCCICVMHRTGQIAFGLATQCVTDV